MDGPVWVVVDHLIRKSRSIVTGVDMCATWLLRLSTVISVRSKEPGPSIASSSKWSNTNAEASIIWSLTKTVASSQTSKVSGC